MTALLLSAARADVLESVDAGPARGQLVAVRPNSVLWHSEGGQQSELKLQDVVRIELEGAEPAATLTEPLAVLSNGDAVAGTLRGGGDQTLDLRSAVLGELSLPMRHVAALLFRRDLPETLQATLLHDAGDRDVVLLRNNERLSGLVKSIGAHAFTFESVLGELPVPFERVSGIAFARTEPLPAPEGLTAMVELADGGRISGRLGAAAAPETLALTPEWGPELSLRLGGAVRAIEIRGGRLVHLSDLEPQGADEVPYLGRVWPYRRDRSVGGGPISLRGKLYRKGLGVHSRSRLVYRLDGQFVRFKVETGIDDATGGRGEVSCRVLGDGKELFVRNSVRGTDAPISLDLDMTGMNVLELVVDYGAGLDIADHADWAGAWLERAPIRAP